MSGDIRESSGVMGGMGKRGMDPTHTDRGCENEHFHIPAHQTYDDIYKDVKGEGVLVRLANVPMDLFGCKFSSCHFRHVFASHHWNGCMVIKSDLLL